MDLTNAKRLERGEGPIYKNEAKERCDAAVSVSYEPDGKTWRRQRVSGCTRAEVAAKLRKLQAEYDSGTDMVRLNGRGPRLVSTW